MGFPLIVAPVVAMVLSLGYDMTQPLFAGIVTSLGAKRPGQAMGLNVFTLFVGFGLGSLIFGEMLRFGFEGALSVFAAVELAIGLLSPLAVSLRDCRPGDSPARRKSVVHSVRMRATYCPLSFPHRR